MGEIKSSNVTGPAHTIADGIAVTAPVPKAVERMKTLVDDIVVVPDEALIEAMRFSASALGLMLEPAGAAGLGGWPTFAPPQMGCPTLRGFRRVGIPDLGSTLGSSLTTGDRRPKSLSSPPTHPNSRQLSHTE